MLKSENISAKLTTYAVRQSENLHHVRTYERAYVLCCDGLGSQIEKKKFSIVSNYLIRKVSLCFGETKMSTYLK